MTTDFGSLKNLFTIGGMPCLWFDCENVGTCFMVPVPRAPGEKNMVLLELNGSNVDVSENSGTPKSSILIGFSIINHQFWGTSIIGNTHVWCHIASLHVFIPPAPRFKTWLIGEKPAPFVGLRWGQFCDPVSKFGYLGLEYPFCVETEDTDPQNGF